MTVSLSIGAFSNAVGRWGVMNSQVSDRSNLFKVVGELLASEFASSVGSQNGDPPTPLDFDPSFKSFVVVENFRFVFKEVYAFLMTE